MKQVGAIYQWNITSNGAVAAQWSVDLKNGAGAVSEGPAKPKADCTLTLSDDDLVGLFNGSLDPMKVCMVHLMMMCVTVTSHRRSWVAS